MITKLAARSMVQPIPDQIRLIKRLFERLTLISRALDEAQTENTNLRLQVERLQARNEELWNMYMAKGGKR